LAVVDSITELFEFIGDGLELLTVDADRGVTLDGVTELGVESVDAGINVVFEELSKGRPEGVSVGCVTEDEIENLSRHPLVDPLDDG
jgi:hypothetical protein